MYKDVKKKLIALVLSICMVATVIEVVPIVRAAAPLFGAAGSNIFKIEASNSAGATVYLLAKVKSTELTYNGSSRVPELDGSVRLYEKSKKDCT